MTPFWGVFGVRTAAICGGIGRAIAEGQTEAERGGYGVVRF